MAKVLIVDGHSVIHAWPELKAAQARSGLSAREKIKDLLLRYSDNTGVHVVLVFDGSGGKNQSEHVTEGLQVFYSRKGLTADAIIERLVAKYSQEHSIIVATNDGMERMTVTSFGAECISAEKLREVIDCAEQNLQKRLAELRRITS
ncbi:MAG: NYN domain-containing protein [Chthoniobacterales bacterium]|nr:NYN domain-containing protein [Chthoniobacterales bacterium]